MSLTDERIIDLFVCHSNFKADKNIHGMEFETISHKRIVDFARALLEEAAATKHKPIRWISKKNESYLRKLTGGGEFYLSAAETDEFPVPVYLEPQAERRYWQVPHVCVGETMVSLLRNGEKVEFDDVVLVRASDLRPLSATEDADASDFTRIMATNSMLGDALRDVQRQLDHEKLLHGQALEKLQTWVTTAAESLKREADQVLQLQSVKRAQDSVYGERNMLVRLLASIYPAGKKKTPIEGWDPEWHWCIYVDLPTGQASWHIHSRELPMFASLPDYQGEWDGHTTEEKYQRVLLATAPGGAAKGAGEIMSALSTAKIVA